MTTKRPAVLIVEDDRSTRELFEYELRLAGFAVTLAGDGLSALQSIEQCRPDAVVLDLDLPHVSGIDVQEEIMAHGELRDMPIIVVTGTEWKVPTGVYRVLRKPVSSDIVANVVQEALASRAET
jgi:CheY-like chemotaxis protein